ncbi:MAG: aminofutalosine synthase MqnE [Candidatus Omnitrophica bacterium]|nr:aminofutalosine synthase MqnE [Candidatus Omnitrophota bacterium]
MQQIIDKLHSSQRLNFEDGMACLRTDDLIGLGRLANEVKRARWGKKVHYVVNRQINPSNLCVLSCKFCDFSSKKGRPDAYEMSVQEVLDKCSEELREVHIVGGLHPTWRLEDYEAMLRAIHERYPHIQIKAFTAVEIDFFAKRERTDVEEVLRRLQAVGLTCLPGGGAEVFSERVRKQLFPFKMGASRWLAIHEIAHRMGIHSNATLLYGHIETYEERVEHMLKLRELQDETRGFLSFIPLAFQPGNSGIVKRAASVVEDLKTIATARLLLDNFDHIKSYWIMLGEETASMALNFGADDLDGTVGEERIAHAALSSSPTLLTRQRIEQLIRESGNEPQERDALYQAVY